ncbi:MAG: hypothetical protein U1E56_08885 [Bauldia sp.]
MAVRWAVWSGAFIAAMPAFAGPAWAHGFGQRFDLPLPLAFWEIGAGLTIVLTFVVMALFVRERADYRYPRFDLMRISPLRALASPPLLSAVRALVALAFLFAIYCGAVGSQDPYSNVIVTLVWIVWWVGLAFLSALVGDVWRVINPFATLFGWAERLFARLTGRSLSLQLAYPTWLGTWPAVLLFAAFAWGELVWPSHDIPAALSRAALVYAAATFVGMFVFGRTTWRDRGEAFTLAFGVLSRFAPIGPEEYGRQATTTAARPLYLRPLGAGLQSEERLPWSTVVFILLMLSTVTFDGFLETPLFQAIFNRVYTTPALARLVDAISGRGIPDAVLIKSVALIAFPLAFVAVYAAVSWLMAKVTRPLVPVDRRPLVAAGPVASAFVLTLVPIAVAYHLSHYFSLLMTAGQFIIPLVSDPMGAGWNLFGTADYQVNIGLVNPKFFWYAAVTLIVLGHVIAVYLAHVAALRFFGTRRAAFVSQVPMVALMVGYTMVSLWILAQPIMA